MKRIIALCDMATLLAIYAFLERRDWLIGLRVDIDREIWERQRRERVVADFENHFH